MSEVGVVDVTADSEDDVAEVVDLGDGEEDVAEETPSGAPPLCFHGYRRGRELGRGASGQVFLCKRRGCASSFAVKSIDLRKIRLSPHMEREQKKLYREVGILKQLPPHPQIVQLVDAFEEGDWFLLVLELVGGGDLYTLLTSREPSRLMESEAAYVFRQLAEGLRFLHAQGIIHRDLKLENVLVASEQRRGPEVLYSVKITDFGLSKAVGVGLSEALSTVGTHPYIAPEVMSTKSYDFSSDLWGLGVLLYVLLAGHFPFETDSTVQVKIDQIVAKLEASAAARSMLRGLLQRQPAMRLSLQEMYSHQWLQDEVQPHEPEPSHKRQRISAVKPSSNQPAADVRGRIPGLQQDQEPLSRSEELPAAAMPAPAAAPVPPLESDTGGRLRELQAALSAEAASADASAEWSDVRSASALPDVMQVHVLMPPGAARAVDEALLSQVASVTGCQTWSAPPEAGRERRVGIIGRYAECAIAQGLLQTCLLGSEDQEHNASVRVVLWVRAEAVGVVSGKQGFCLQQMRKQSGATVRLLQEEVAGQRPCIIMGTLPSILQAERHIFDLVNAVPVAGCTGSQLAEAPVLPSAGTGTRLLVPSDLADTVVGKQGSGLRRIRGRCGVKVQMLHEAQAPHWPNNRVLILRGPLSSRQAALDAVLELTGIAGQDACSLQMLVPVAQADSVSAQQGFLAQSVGPGCSVIVDREEIQDERLVLVTGLRGQVLSKAVAILRILEGIEDPPTGPTRAAQKELPVT